MLLGVYKSPVNTAISIQSPTTLSAHLTEITKMIRQNVFSLVGLTVEQNSKKSQEMNEFLAAL